jgi:excisionase family DNA binding protein
MDNKEYYTSEEIARILSIHVATVRRWIREGKLPAILLGKSYRVTKEDLRRFLEERRTNKKA